MNRPKILLQFDSDPHPSSFDAIVAIDAGVDQLISHGRVEPASVEGLVHGAMFTRGGDDLRRTAIFIGGSETNAGEALLRAVRHCFFGPVRVSVLLDSNGCNTTAAAAVLTAWKHVQLTNNSALVLGGTGPVGQRVARLLRGVGCQVKLASRSMSRATEVARSLNESTAGTGSIEPVEVASLAAAAESLGNSQIVISAGAAGVRFTTTDFLEKYTQLKVAIDLNAVPPLGIEGIAATDKGVDRGGRFDYGALGVGGLKMKIHRAAIERLFEANNRVMDAEEVLQIGRELLG